MRFHLVDRIDELLPERAVRARKLTSRLESHWVDDGREPEMPPVLVLEALCQAGTWLVMASTGLARRATLVSVERVRHEAPVRPGDVLDIEAWAETIGADTAVVSGRVSVGGRTVLEATDVMCAMVPTDSLEDPADVARAFALLSRGTAP